MDVEQLHIQQTLDTTTVISALLNEWSAVTDYRTLRDSLPRRLAHLLKCRSVLLYSRINETLQFTSGSFDDIPGWSAALLAIAHINPIELDSDLPEARAWRTHSAVVQVAEHTPPLLAAVPLLYRQRAIGVLVAFRSTAEVQLERRHVVTDALTMDNGDSSKVAYWSEVDIPVLETVAGVVALLLENTRLLERDRQRIHELSLLNNIANQLNYVGYAPDRVYNIVVQRTQEITGVDLCSLITPTTSGEADSWLTPVVRELLFERFSKQREGHIAPLILEHLGDPQAHELLELLPANIKTFFAIPMVMNESILHNNNENVRTRTALEKKGMPGTTVLGIVVGAYFKTWKLRREELVLLQVLCNSASAALENIHLLAEVVEARNEARKLLRQVLDDVAAMQRMEEENRRLDRLAVLGEMSASVAHEVRNPLASIKTSMQMLKDDLGEANRGQTELEEGKAGMYEDAHESVTVVLKEVERLDAIVRDLLLFARPRQLHCVRCNLAELSDHVLQVMQLQCAACGVTVQKAYREVSPVFVDVAQMEQVLFNLFTNALQAMTDGGVLTVACGIVTMEQRIARQTRLEAELSLHVGIPIGMSSVSQRWLELTVSDSGTGITPEQLKRIFQPFFTTKAHGIGLGLPITRRLIEDHRGHLLVESRLGQGAAFSVCLPLADEVSDTTM